MKMIIKLSKAEMRQIKEFAHRRMNNVSVYRKRGGFKYMDIVIGAMAEFGAQAFLIDLGIIVSEPDLKIYRNKDKSFNADLVSEDKFFHIKGQDSSRASTYCDSWLVQKTDPIIVNPKNNHYFMFCTVDVVEESVHIRACVPARTLVSKELLGEPVLPFLQETKHAIYLEDLEDNLNINQLWSALRA
jgi:hypothetical protein